MLRKMRLAVLAAILATVSGPCAAWRYAEVKDQIGNKPTEQVVSSMDLTSGGVAAFRCSNASNLSLFYQVPHIVSDDELAQLRKEGAKIGVTIWEDPGDEAILIETRFERTANGKLLMIGYGDKLREIVLSLRRMNLSIGLVLDVPSREAYSFQSAAMVGRTFEQFLYFTKGCGIN